MLDIIRISYSGITDGNKETIFNYLETHKIKYEFVDILGTKHLSIAPSTLNKQMSNEDVINLLIMLRDNVSIDHQIHAEVSGEVIPKG